MRWLAGIFVILLFLLSLLNEFKPPTMQLWQISVLTKEYGVYFALLQILCTVYVLARSLHGWLTVVLSQMLIACISIFLFLSPVYEAQNQVEQFSQALNEGFPNTSGAQIKLSIDKWELFNLWPPPKVTPETLIYSTTYEYNLELDFYKVAGTTPKPLIVMIHGGGWSGGDLHQLPQVNNKLVDMGYNVASIAYRFTPNYKWPAQQEDVFAALDFLFERASLLGFDTSNVFVMGRSAGGQLAGIAGYKYKKHPLRGVILLYPPTDMAWGYELSEEHDMLKSRQLLEDLLGGNPFEKEAAYTDASPIFFLDQAIPTLLFHGRPDPLTFYRHSERLNNRLKKRRVPSAFIRFDWATHGFDFNIHGPAGQVLFPAIDYFIKRNLASAP